MKQTVCFPLIVIPPKVGDIGPSWAVFPATYNAEERGVPTYWTFAEALDNARLWACHEIQLRSIAKTLKR